eukprot:2452089-Alexandrium_andersonii.AAC.1
MLSSVAGGDSGGPGVGGRANWLPRGLPGLLGQPPLMLSSVAGGDNGTSGVAGRAGWPPGGGGCEGGWEAAAEPRWSAHHKRSS